MASSVNQSQIDQEKIGIWGKLVYAIGGNPYRKGEDAKSVEEYRKALSCYKEALVQLGRGRKLTQKDKTLVSIKEVQSKIFECFYYSMNPRGACNFFDTGLKVHELTINGFFCVVSSAFRVVTMKTPNSLNNREERYQDIQRGIFGLLKIKCLSDSDELLSWLQLISYVNGMQYYYELQDFEASLACYHNARILYHDEWIADFHELGDRLELENLEYDSLKSALIEINTRLEILGVASLSKPNLGESREKFIQPDLEFTARYLSELQKDLSSNGSSIDNDSMEECELIEAYVSQGDTYVKKEMYNEALSSYLGGCIALKSIEKTDPFWNRNLQIKLYLTLGSCFFDLNENEKALYFYRKLLQLQLFYSPPSDVATTQNKIKAILKKPSSG